MCNSIDVKTEQRSRDGTEWTNGKLGNTSGLSTVHPWRRGGFAVFEVPINVVSRQKGYNDCQSWTQLPEPHCTTEATHPLYPRHRRKAGSRTVRVDGSPLFEGAVERAKMYDYVVRFRMCVLAMQVIFYSRT